FADRQDRKVNAFFHSSFQGAKIRGTIVVSTQEGKGSAAILFDREDLFARSLPALSKKMSASIPRGRSGSDPLVRTPLTDGSGFIGLPAGWKITGAYKGTVDVVGPQGQAISLGGYQHVFRTGAPNSPLMFGPYCPPAVAWQRYVDFSNQHAISRGQAS